MWVLAAVLALLFLLLFFPLRLRFTLFEGEAQLEAHLLFFRFRLFGEKKGKKREKKLVKGEKGAPKKAAAKGRQKKKEGPFSGPWDAERICAAARLLKELLSACGRSGAFLLKNVRISRLWLEMMVVRRDAYRTAEESGRLNAWFYGALSLLENYIQPADLYISIYPGFWATRETVAVDIIVSVTPARLLGAGGLLLFGALGAFIRFIRPPKHRAGHSPAAVSEEAAAGSDS